MLQILILIFLTYILLSVLPYLLFSFLAGYLALKIYRKVYFNSEKFIEHKDKVSDFIKEYNELAEYFQEQNENVGLQFLNNSQHTHLSKTINTSRHKYKRNRNVDSNESNVRPSSLNIVRSASRDPIKYLDKYFILGDEEENLQKLEQKLEQLIKLENALDNLEERKLRIEDEFKAPWIINKFFHDELMEQIGINVQGIKVDYQDFVFEYVSDGGNSSQKTVITLDEEVLEETILYLSKKIERKKSVTYQRSLMTPKLRQQIKDRDNHTCQFCDVSIYDQDLLLLEIDHIIPVSKGGLSIPDNLQTLCWKCNRSKSDKIL